MTRHATFKSQILDDIAEYYDVETDIESTPPPDEICLYNIPEGTHNFSCSNQHLNYICANLPKSLTHFDCSNNALIQLPPLPDNLQYLNCNDNKLSALPEHLPASLTIICCANNHIEILPDLPPNLSEYSYFSGNPLTANYPKLFEILRQVVRPLRFAVAADYVNYCNAEMRKRVLKERMDKYINPDNILWKLYMERKMHPRFLDPVKNDENINLDDFINKYLENL